MQDLRSLAPTICRLMQVAPPALAVSEPFTELLSRSDRVDKVLVYCPDAFGTHALERFPVLHERLRRASTHEIELSSIFPPKTPVCFASLFTGGTPEQHGIKRYERPVLSCDTVFDALARAGKKVAIVAVRDSSIDLIFRERPIDYFSPTYDPLVTSQALDLLKANQHDVIVVYHQEYDDLLHRTGPFSELATHALSTTYRRGKCWRALPQRRGDMTIFWHSPLTTAATSIRPREEATTAKTVRKTCSSDISSSAHKNLPSIRADALHLLAQQVCDEAHPRDVERRLRAHEAQHAALRRPHVHVDRDDPARPGESMGHAAEHDRAGARLGGGEIDQEVVRREGRHEARNDRLEHRLRR